MNLLQRRIKAAVKRHGSLRAAARVLNIDHGYLSRLQSGEMTEPSDALLLKLWLRRVVSYEPRLKLARSPRTTRSSHD